MKIKKTFIIIVYIMIITSMANAQIITGINQWLIAGSYSDISLSDQHTKSFLNEAELSPVAGEKAGINTWKEVSKHSINFLEMGYKEQTNSVVYAFAYIYSGEDQLATILLGSDDGAMVWLNGLKVWDNPRDRGLTEDEDKIYVQLSKGYNRLLVKVNNGGGDWGLVCNISSDKAVSVSLNRPSANKIAAKKDLAIVGTSVWMKQKNAVITVKLNNFSKTDLNKVQCGLYGSTDKKIAEQSNVSIKSEKPSEVAFEMPVKQALQIVTQQGNYASVTAGSLKNSAILPGTLALDLFMTLTKDNNYADAETQKMARQLDFAKEVYGTTKNILPLAIEGLGDIADTKNDKVKAVLQQMIQEIVKSSPDLSNETIHVVGHAHMDMNWLWPYSETKKMMHDNIRQVIAFMEKYPDFTMLQSQATIYKYIKTVDPPLFEKVKKYVKEGRFEIVGGMWVEGDCNLSGGEALCRSFLLAQHFFNDNFGKTAKVGWLPDNFGHISQFPQMLKLAGCDYYYFTRCNPYSGTFWWKAPDSSTVLCFSGNGYGNSIKPAIRKEIPELSPVKHRILWPTGVGDHGGGPTINDINMIHKLDSTPHFPSIKFTTAENFFKSSLNEMDNRPIHRKDMQYIFEGCYTSIAGIKENARKSEQSLYKSEFLSSLRWLYGESYPAVAYKDLWEAVTFNQFHDISCGSAIYESNQEALADFNYVEKKSDDMFDAAFRHMADEIPFKTGIGQPIVALNMHPYNKKTIVTGEIFTYKEPVSGVLGGDYIKAKNAEVPGIMVSDNTGKTYIAQIIGGRETPPGFRSQVEFVVDDMPAGGYKTFYIDATKPGISDKKIAEKDGKFETDFYNIEFDMKTGDIIRLKDKKTGKEYVAPNGKLNKLYMEMEAPNGMSAWTIGKILEVQDITTVEDAKVVEYGPVRACVQVTKKWGRSKFIQKIYIYQSYPRIDFTLDAHWFEIGDGKNTSPFLKTSFDLAYDNPTFYNHVPFDVMVRPNNGQEVPAQQWVDVTDGTTGIALLNKTKFGHSLTKNKLKLSLLRATFSPDIYPNLGINHIEYSLMPHSGDWKNGVWKEADDFNVPVYAAEPPSVSLSKPNATKPAEDSLLIVSPSTIVMSGIKQSEDGNNLIIRLAEVYGNETLTTITLPVTAKSVDIVNILEYPMTNDNRPTVDGKKIHVKIRAHEIMTLSVRVM